MKNSYFLFPITRIVLLSSLLIATACKDFFEEDPILEEAQRNRELALKATPQTINNQPYEVRLAYTYHHLDVLGKAVMSYANDERFREVLYREVEKKPFGESTVLLPTLFQESMKNGVSMLEKENKFVSAADLEKAQKAFYDVDSMVYYPQVYIPYYEERKQTGAASRKSAAKANNPPVVVIYAEDDIDKKEYPAYTLNEKDSLVEAGFMVDEAYVKENEVWVISMSEDVEMKTNMVPIECSDNPYLPGCPTPRPPSPPKPPKPPVPGPARYCTYDGNTSYALNAPYGISVHVSQLKLKNDRDGFLGGKSEIKISMTSIWESGYNTFTSRSDRSEWWEVSSGSLYGQPYPEYHYKKTGLLITNVFLNQINKDLYPHKTIVQDWGGLVVAYKPGQGPGGYGFTTDKDTRRDAVVYLVYDDDPWPTREENYTKGVGTSGKTLSGKTGSNSFFYLVYRSREAPLVTGSFNWYQGSDNYACGERVDTNDIKFLLLTDIGDPY